MCKILISTLLLFSIPGFSQVVRDTLYFDANGYKTEPNTVATYKVVTSENGARIANIDEYDASTHVLRSKGKGYKVGSETLVYEGEAKYYSPQGKEEATYIYENGEVSKIFSENAFTGEKYEGEFRNGSLYNGTVFKRKKDVYLLLEAIDGFFTKNQIIDSENQDHKIIYQYGANNNLEREIYYGKEGKPVSEATYSESEPQNGTVTNIDSDKFTVLSIATYKNGKAISGKEFYQNGDLKSKSEFDNNIKTQFFFDQNSQIIGKYSAMLNEKGDVLSQDGTLVLFNTYGDPDWIYGIYTFQNDVTVKYASYYSDRVNNPQKIQYYENGYNKRTEFFNPDGTLKGELTYDESGLNPLNGTMFDKSLTTIYKEGEVVEKTSFYDNGKVFEKYNDLQSVYFDEQGNEIGRLTYKKDEYSQYIDPYNGSLLYSNGLGISAQYKYENGISNYIATYDRYEGKSVLKEENFYMNNAVAKNVYYYSDGTKRNEEVFAVDIYSNQPELITYYDPKGRFLSTYKPKKNEGTKYDFFADGQIKLIEKYSDGVLVTKKQYREVTDTPWRNEPNRKFQVYLFCEIDYANEGKFYSADGNLVSTVTYKDGQPYSGKALDNDPDSYTSTETEYKNGEKDGTEIIKHIDNDEIISKTYYINGEKVKEEAFSDGIMQKSILYQNNLAEGEATFYNSEGSKISTLIYREGLPYEGTYHYQNGFNYSIKEQYSNGDLISRQIFNDKILLVSEEKNIENNKVTRSIFDINGMPVYVYEKNSNNLLDGKYEYYENGKIRFKATLQEGMLINGTIAVQDLNIIYTYGNSVNHTVISYNKEKLKLEVLNNLTRKVEFSMESIIKQNNNELNPILSKGIAIFNLYPYSEFNSEY